MDIKEYKKHYRESHKTEIAAYRKKHNSLPRVKLMRKKWDTKYHNTKKGLLAHKKAIHKYKTSFRGKFNARKYQQELRSKVINLYTDATNVCMECGGRVDHVHHVNPNDGKNEIKLFGNIGNFQARKYQLDMYSENPNYVRPLCAACHKIIHDKLRFSRSVE
jgi:hypothetical protein